MSKLWCRTHNQEATKPIGDGFVCPSAFMGAGVCMVVPERKQTARPPKTKAKTVRLVGKKKN
jgi:hypothetical protein